MNVRFASLAVAVVPITLGLLSARAQAEPKTNLLNQWSEGSDAAAIAKLGEMFTEAGGKWEATSIAGHTANTLAKLRADVVSGNPPPAVQLKGPEIAEWNATGKTLNLDEIAKSEGWDKTVAPELLPVMKPKGSWVAVPMNIHRINWMWGGKKALDQAGITSMPATWAEFNADCDKLKAAGLIPIAHGSADWTDATTFEIVVYGMDMDLFKKAFVEGDSATMRSDGMVKCFEQFRKMINNMDPGISARTWDAAANMMLTGKAGFFFMGDWSIGTFNAGGFKEGVDYLCSQAPEDNGKTGFILNSDSVVFFQQKDKDYLAGSKLLAHLIMSKDFQVIFNKAKGSIPARLDIDLTGFNPCQIKCQKDLEEAIKEGTLVRSFAHNMTILQKYRGAAMEVITNFVNTPGLSAADAAKQMADAVDAQK
ncbi:MAG: carbohydrate ABC transporter substrate-binding protein [Verrucomicrobia bacterium]|nr:carbohydrate ABC transporter substrate-binding protein [Verrucomicrobiota bacterium]